MWLKRWSPPLEAGRQAEQLALSCGMPAYQVAVQPAVPSWGRYWTDTQKDNFNFCSFGGKYQLKFSIKLCLFNQYFLGLHCVSHTFQFQFQMFILYLYTSSVLLSSQRAVSALYGCHMEMCSLNASDHRVQNTLELTVVDGLSFKSNFPTLQSTSIPRAAPPHLCYS